MLSILPVGWLKSAYFSYVSFLGAVHTPNRFTLTDVSSAHGSDANAGCPSACVRMVSSVRVCDCVGVTTDRTGITLIDGVIPMLDVSQPNWATQLYTATSNQLMLSIDFLFQYNYILRQVDLYLFICLQQNIPNQGLLSISVYQSVIFPRGAKGQLLGNVSLFIEQQNCTDLIQISIPINSTLVLNLYLIEFSMDNVLGGIYIGEIKFLDAIALITSSKYSTS